MDIWLDLGAIQVMNEKDIAVWWLEASFGGAAREVI